MLILHPLKTLVVLQSSLACVILTDDPASRQVTYFDGKFRLKTLVQDISRLFKVIMILLEELIHHAVNVRESAAKSVLKIWGLQGHLFRLCSEIFFDKLLALVNLMHLFCV